MFPEIDSVPGGPIAAPPLQSLGPRESPTGSGSVSDSAILQKLTGISGYIPFMGRCEVSLQITLRDVSAELAYPVT